MSTKSSKSPSASPSELPGVAPATLRALRAVGIRTPFDVLSTLPVAVVDLRAPLSGTEIVEHVRRGGGLTALQGEVEKVSLVPLRGRRAIRVAVRSAGVLVELWWFYMNAQARTLAGPIVASGVPTADARRANVVRIVHPRLHAAGGLEPQYAVPGVSTAKFADAVRSCLADDPTVRAVHAPTDLEVHRAAREQLRSRYAWAEAAWLVSRRLERERAQAGATARPLPDDAAVRARLLAALGFAPTGAQEKAIARLGERLDSERPTRTLLTGDVGTGKTAVILAAAAQAVAAGAQVALLAPTTILADQYRAALAPIAAATGASIELAPPMRSSKPRVLDADVVVGTHALLSDRVRFSKLGLVIVDEQHRLGVGQRLSLVAKGGEVVPHLLSVSATPIPRTLALALRGEIENVHLDERPAGRGVPSTRAVSRGAWTADVRKALDDALATGDRVFVVCATIGRDEQDGREQAGSPGAEARAKELRKSLGVDVALVHGDLADEEIHAAIAAFREGRARVLVGTSMLEVGLDVPEATLMVIDGADRLGLAQLHQLRGRVGRGARPGSCLLVHDDLVSELARARLAALIEAPDGLAVARADLALRGAGDLDGARQAGAAAGLHWLDPLADEAIAEDAARAVARGDALDADGERVFARLDALAAARVLTRGEAG